MTQTDEIPNHMRAELARIGVVLPKPENVKYPTPWKPAYKGEEPPF